MFPHSSSRKLDEQFQEKVFLVLVEVEFSRSIALNYCRYFVRNRESMIGQQEESEETTLKLIEY